ncbi:TetR/AcrR family transcriptional regulator [Chitinophaga qingshengii]|uniref:TetR/AcrR family transcriptional regulator n=1 Tax=Chitinophaga qingshengii TaxID=1569794 RepID=A0ABR7TNW8_9BACT|nr:TetR/AcrR family transcriptional regulator [Chitinophaga qingshengii]MBC9932168.1 TetR/AcrR family transcriptional regulator [Chitinophaga qingshengii]
MATGKKEQDASTEEKILAAARIVFTRKGFAATKVRDIAAEADINLSLVNYYFRSKEKLFEVVMAEAVQKLVFEIATIFNDEQLDIPEKITKAINYYIDLLLENPDFPLFLVNEIIAGDDMFTRYAQQNTLFKSHLFRQLYELKAAGKLSVHPVHIMMNVIGMVVMPFLARPLLERNELVKDNEFVTLMNERRKLIPLWLKGMLG